jgi:hypothetical protein
VLLVLCRSRAFSHSLFLTAMASSCPLTSRHSVPGYIAAIQGRWAAHSVTAQETLAHYRVDQFPHGTSRVPSLESHRLPCVPEVNGLTA